MLELAANDPLAQALVASIQSGDLPTLERLLADRPSLAQTRIVNARGGQRALLHIATDWPGFFPNAPAAVRLLLTAGADPNARMLGPAPGETPLHWAASSDDVEVARVLLDGGADLEATGASIAGGTPLDDAVAYGCWQVARLLVQRGAKVVKLWHAAALGHLDVLAEMLSSTPPPAADAVNEAFWHACHGGQRRAAELLLGHGADPTWIPPYSQSTALENAARPDTARQLLVDWLRTKLS